MIQASDIKKALDQRPFVPFELHLDNGRVVPVQQQDSLLFNESRTMVLIVEQDSFHHIPLSHVTDLIVRGQPSVAQLTG
jgi:outer membrane lipoprotein SlyB